jgi:polysaccharide biosynthesis/export protein
MRSDHHQCGDRRLSLLAPLAAILLLGACVSDDLEDAPAAKATPAAYQLGPGDKVRVVTYGEETLTGEFAVAPSGDIAFPLIGDVNAQGRTAVELQKAIATKLAAGYVREPRVAVEVVNFRPFYILGEVNRPGEYPYVSGMTVRQAVATAQGFTYRANTGKVLVKHAGDPNERAYHLSAATPVEPGDTLRIVERYF